MKKNNRGFSLVELMVVVGMLGGLGLVVMNITKQSTKSSAKLQFDSDMTLTTNEINGILSDPAKCFTTLGSTATPASIVGKYYTTASGSAPANGYGNSGLKITSYTLTGTAPDGVLTIAYQNKNILKGTGGQANINKTINLYIEGVLGAITKCRALSSSTTDIWTHGTATDANNVFYNGGVRAGDETQTITCDSITEGTQRYNKTTHAMEYCGASGSPLVYAWTGFGGGSHGVKGFRVVGTTSWTVPTGVTTVWVTAAGGGGGGGNGNGSNIPGAGGGGGAAALYQEITVTPGQIISITVGAGGASSSAAPNSSGGNGSQSCFGTTCFAGGSGAVGSTPGAAGGLGGVMGGYGSPLYSYGYTGGVGGGTLIGAGGTTSNYIIVAYGVPGGLYGSGGGGSSIVATSGTGAQGAVFVLW